MTNQVVYGSRDIAPSKVVCVGRNYVEHIKELNNPMPGEIVLFIKPNSAIAGRLQVPGERCRYEAEICLLMEGGEVVAVGFGLDLTLVEVQQRLKSKGLPWEKAKAFDGAAVLSPFVDAPASLDQLSLQLWINDELRQEGGVPLMIHKPHTLLEECVRHFSLCDGDIVMTGTPKGVGDLKAGDTLVGKLFDGETLLLEHTFA